MKYHVEVNTLSDAEGVWTGNAVNHNSADEAIYAAKDLFSRWMAVRYWRVVDDDGKVVEELK